VKLLRIIAGTFGGRKLKSVDGLTTRPTADKIKEAVFSSIGNDIYDANILDVFSGTGSIALEAISRGAKSAVLIEQNKAAQKVILENIRLCGVEEQCLLLKGDSFQILKQLGHQNQKFHIIYLDPPYKEGFYESILNIIQEYSLLEKDGLLIAESEKNTSILPKNSLFCIYKEKYYGISKITYLKWNKTQEV